MRPDSRVASLPLYGRNLSAEDALGCVDNFMEFAVIASSHGDAMKQCFLTAGVVDLMLPILRSHMQPSYYERFQHAWDVIPDGHGKQDESRRKRRKKDIVELLKYMRSHGIPPLLVREVADHQTNYNKRRRCCKTLEALLSPSDGRATGASKTSRRP